MENGGARLFLKPGKGKTGVVLKAFDILKKVGYVDCLLVLAPLRVITTSWPQELDKWDFCEKFKYQTIHGGKTARLEAMEADADVYLMNVEGLLSSEWRLGPKARGYPCNEVALAFLRGRRVMVAIDESTKFKNGSSSRYKVLKKYLKYFARRVIMTGTPKPNKLEDLFHQCYLTDLGADLGEFVTHFRMHHMMLDPTSTNHDWIPQFGALEKVAAKIAPTTLQLEQDEAVPVTEHDVWVEMPKELRAKYRELEKDFLTEIEGKTIMAFNGGVKWGKLKQFAQGAIYLTEGRPEDGYMELFDSKLDALENLLEELISPQSHVTEEFAIFVSIQSTSRRTNV